MDENRVLLTRQQKLEAAVPTSMQRTPAGEGEKGSAFYRTDTWCSNEWKLMDIVSQMSLRDVNRINYPVAAVYIPPERNLINAQNNFLGAQFVLFYNSVLYEGQHMFVLLCNPIS